MSWYAASKFWLVFFLVLLFKTVTVFALSNANKVPTFFSKSLILSSSEPKAALSMERLHCPSLSYVRPQFQSTSLLKSLLPIVTKFYIKHLIKAIVQMVPGPGCVAQSVARMTRAQEVPGPMPGPVT